MKKVAAENRDIAFYLKLYPLPGHKEAYNKAKAIVCGKKMSLLEDAYQQKPLPKPNCKSSAVDDTIKLANSLGIGGAPAIIMPDGRIEMGYKDAKALKETIYKK